MGFIDTYVGPLIEGGTVRHAGNLMRVSPDVLSAQVVKDLREPEAEFSILSVKEAGLRFQWVETYFLSGLPSTRHR